MELVEVVALAVVVRLDGNGTASVIKDTGFFSANEVPKFTARGYLWLRGQCTVQIDEKKIRRRVRKGDRTAKQALEAVVLEEIRREADARDLVLRQ